MAVPGPTTACAAPTKVFVHGKCASNLCADVSPFSLDVHTKMGGFAAQALAFTMGVASIWDMPCALGHGTNLDRVTDCWGNLGIPMLEQCLGFMRDYCARPVPPALRANYNNYNKSFSGNAFSPSQPRQQLEAIGSPLAPTMPLVCCAWPTDFFQLVKQLTCFVVHQWRWDRPTPEQRHPRTLRHGLANSNPHC